MGYFDRLIFGGLFDQAADMAFRKNSDGSVVFHPWGMMGNGYLLTPDKERQLRAFLGIYMRIAMGSAFVATLLGVVVTGVLITETTLLLGFLLLLVSAVLVYAAVIPYMLAGMPHITEKRSFAEEYKYAWSTGKVALETLRPKFRYQWFIWILLACVLNWIARRFWLS